MDQALELLDIVISWPVAALVLVAAFRKPISEILTLFVDTLRKRSGDITEVKAGPVGVKFEASTQVDIIEPAHGRGGEAIQEIVRKEEEARRADKFPLGLVEVFAGEESISRGAGFIVTEEGYGVTALHAVMDSQTVRVRIPEGGEWVEAEVTARDEDTLLALLKLTGQRHSAVQLGSSAGLVPGVTLRRYGFKSPYAEGVLRENAGTFSIKAEKLYVVTDALVTTPMSVGGDSGLPVFNDGLKVIGAIVGGSEQVTIVIPIEKICKAFPQLRC